MGNYGLVPGSIAGFTKHNNIEMHRNAILYIQLVTDNQILFSDGCPMSSMH